MDTKVCSKCNVEKPLGEFHKDPRQRFGVRPDCKECKRKKNKKGYEKNKDRRMEYKKEQMRRYRKDPVFRMRECVSRHVRIAMMSESMNKRLPTFDHLPYTPKELMEHIESQFDDKMSWDNYGTYWHVDHIYPQSLLPYDSYEHPNFLRCWALDNLRPLEARENMSKGNKVTYFQTQERVIAIDL